MEENVIQIKGRIAIKEDASVKKNHKWKKEYIWNSATFCGKDGKCLSSITDKSVITCDEIIEETKTVPTNFNEKHI